MVKSISVSGGLALFALIASGCGGSGEPLALEGDHSFSIAYTQSNFGNIEPCACNNRTKGGFPRRATALNSLRDAGVALLTLDSGDSLFSERYVSRDSLPQSMAKARAIASAYSATDIDAMVLGELDLSAGGAYYLQLVTDYSLPVLAANVKYRKTGDTVFEPYKIFERDGVRIGVIGIVAPEVRRIVSTTNESGSTQTSLSKDQHVLVEELFEGTVVVEDPIETAREIVEKIRGETHVLVVLSHMSSRMAREFAAAVDEVDIIVGSHLPANHVDHQIISSCLLLNGPMNGTVVGVADFEVSAGHLVFADYSKIEEYRQRLPRLKAARDELVTKFKSDDPEVIEAIDKRGAVKLREMDHAIAGMSKHLVMADESPGSFFSVREIHLDGDGQEDAPELTELVRKYRAGLAKLYDEADMTVSPAIDALPGTQAITKDVGCIACHKAQYEFWSNTKHAHAWQTMLDYDAQYDLECITCHTVGYMAPGGFDRPDRVAGFENVQCESCHGAGSYHVDGIAFLDRTKIIGDAGKMRCEECHNDEHSPDFDRSRYIKMVSCPPMNPNEPVIRGALGMARKQMDANLTGEEPPARFFQAAIDLDLRLSNYGAALALAERGLGFYPDNVNILLGCARAYDGLGRSSEGLALLYDAYESSDRNPRLWKEIVSLLMDARDFSARDIDAARACLDYALSSFGGRDPSWNLLYARLLHREGDLDGAVNIMDRIITGMGVNISPYTDFNEEWQAERRAQQEYLLPPPRDLIPE